MQGFMIRGRDLILPGWRWLYEPQVGVSTPFEAVSTRGTNVFIPDSLEFHMYGMIDDAGMGLLSLPGGAGFTNSRLRFSKQPAGLGFPHRARRCRPGGPPVC